MNYMKDIMAIVIAAGKGTRMKSKNSKLVQKIYGKEIVKRAYENVKKAGVEDIIVVVGHQKEQVMEVLGENAKYVEQKEMLGTGHAVMQATELLKEKKGKILAVYGDVPLLKPETLKKLLDRSLERNEAATMLTAIYEDPKGYGRVIRNSEGNVEAIVEELDASEEQRKIQEINAGIYCFDIAELLEALTQIKPSPVKGEYYLTDVIGIMAAKGLKVGAVVVEDNSEILGVNDRMQLQMLTKVLQHRINSELMYSGVTIEDINSTYIYDDVKIGIDTVIHPNTIIKSNVEIGEDCEIGPNAYIREGCKIGNNVNIGNYVELKNAIIGENTKIPHLSYMGDCEIGANVNVGCGSITCNYDGFKKSKTIIEDNCFVGSNTNFIAPVKIEKDSFIAAGSTITEDVPEGSLAIARQTQTNKEKWNKK